MKIIRTLFTSLIITALILSTGSLYTPNIYAFTGSTLADQAIYGSDQPESAITPVAQIPKTGLPEISREHDDSSVIAKLETGASLDELNEALKMADSIVPVTVTRDDIAMDHIRLTLSEGVTAEQAIAQLSNVPQIENVQPNFIYHLPDEALTDSSSADNHLSAQSTITNDKYMNYNATWSHRAINAFEAWDLQKTEGKISVAVIDSLIDINHPDLKDNIVAYHDATGYGWDTSNDMCNHGTHVSGIVSARANNGIGTAGISYNAGLVAVRAMDDYGSGSTYDFLNGFQYVIDNKDKYNIRVVNLSVGGPMDSAAPLYSLTQNDAAFILAVNDLYNAGILSVIAAGNEYPEFAPPYRIYPVDWSGYSVGVISLADKNGDDIPEESELDQLSRTKSSNFNLPGERSKNISAPGRLIFNCLNDNSYYYKSGTSQATPCVSGVASLIYAYNPGFSPAQVKDILYSSARDIGAAGWDEEYGFGCVDAKKAVEYAQAGLYFSTGVSEILVGSSLTLTPSRAGSFTWVSDNPSIASVSDGVVTGNKAGIATITAMGTDGVKISREIAVLDLSLSLPSSMAVGDTINATISNNTTNGYLWDFESSDPTIIEAKYTENGRTLNLNSLSLTALKTGTVNITLRCGSTSRSFKVKVIEDQMAKAKITGVTNKTYTGSPITQKPTVKFNNKTLKKGTDYTISYKNNVNAGTATMIITGKGKYHGVRSVDFTIKKKANPLKLKGQSIGISSAVLKYKSKTVSQKNFLTITKKGVGKLRYSKKSGNKKISVNSTTGALKIAQGIKHGRYIVKINVSAAGNKNYKNITKTVKVTVRIT